MEQMQGYAIARSTLVTYLKKLLQLAESKKQKEISLSLGDSLKKLQEDIFYLVVLGEFKRGKSTFINALLGESILPAAVVPLTAAVTKISYGDSPSAVVNFLNGDSREVALDEIEAYITEKGNPENKKQVSCLEIFHPSPLLARGTVLVDTPGIGSIFDHNTLATYEFVPKVDAAIFLLTVDHPLSQAEYSFLQEVREHVPRIYFALNKIDNVSPGELEESMQFTNRTLGEYFEEEEVNIFPISSKMALEARQNDDTKLLQQSRLPALEKEILRFLEEDKFRVAVSSAAVKTKNNAAKLKFQLDLEEKALMMPLKELQEKETKLNNFMERIRRENRQQRHVLEGESRELLREVLEELNKQREEEIHDQKRQAEEWYLNNAHLSTGELIRRWNYHLYQHLTSFFEKKKQEWENELEKRMRALISAHEEHAKELLERVEKETANIFQVDLPEVKEWELLPEREEFRFLVGTLKDFLPHDPDFFVKEKKLIFRLLPPFLGRRLVLQEMKAIVFEQVDRNYGRLREDLSQRFHMGTRNFARNLENALEAMAANIANSLEWARHQRKSNSEYYQRAYRELQEQRKQIVDILQELECNL